MKYSRVLLIDDDEDDQELFLIAIREIAASIECTALSSARTALRQLETHALAADLIFLDLNMPIMTGQQFLSELNKKEELNRILVIILSTSLIKQKGARLYYQDLPTIDAISLQMTQLFSNLISNALKYTRPDNAPLITITVNIQDGQVHIEVRDNGIGFEQQYADRIFSIFQRLHRKTEYIGTGLGLAMCKKIAQTTRAISCHQRAGQGAVFHVGTSRSPLKIVDSWQLGQILHIVSIFLLHKFFSFPSFSQSGIKILYWSYN